MRLEHVNILALTLAFSLAIGGTLLVKDQAIGPAYTTSTYTPVKRVSDTVIDARGQRLPVRPYQRIASLNPVADRLLLELVEPNRLVAVTAYSVQKHPDGWRFKQQAEIATSNDIESILAANPDLVIASQFTAASYIARLNEENIAVFDLGEARGAATTLANIETLATLLDATQRGERLANSYRRQLSALETRTRDLPRKQGLYLSFYADAFFGGTTGSSYADMLRYAGVSDLAAKHGYKDWPKYTPAQVLAMNPEMIITQRGMGSAICRHSILKSLPACATGGRVIELPDGYDSDAGLGLVHAARVLRTLVYGE